MTKIVQPQFDIAAEFARRDDVVVLASSLALGARIARDKFQRRVACPTRSRRRPHGGPAASRRYERRRPEKTPLHKIISENLESWLEPSAIAALTKIFLDEIERLLCAAELMARVGEEFPLECPACGGDIRLREDGRQEPAHFEPEVRKRKKARMASPA